VWLNIILFQALFFLLGFLNWNHNLQKSVATLLSPKHACILKKSTKHSDFNPIRLSKIHKLLQLVCRTGNPPVILDKTGKNFDWAGSHLQG
jgi:hypothetical protein